MERKVLFMHNEPLLEIDKLRASIASKIHYLKENNAISPALYAEYDIKRGLRNANGTGVLVGITRISEVRGYTVEDGKKIPCEGQLMYRGIPITDLVHGFEREDRLGFEEIVHLLLFGSLPNRQELDWFCGTLQRRRVFPDNFKEDIFLRIPSNNLMNKLQRVVLSLYSYDEDPDNIELGNVLAQCLDLIAKMPLMVAYAYAAKEHYFNDKSLIIHQPLAGGSTAENILHLIRKDSEFTPLEAKILDLCLILQADHGGGNNSAFATHVVSSSGTDTYSAISTAIGSLKGPRHGAANQRAHAMVKDIQEHVQHWNDDGEVADYLRKILAGEAFDRSYFPDAEGKALQIATLIKCTRALWIIPLALITTLIFKEKNSKIYIPWFIFLFVLAMVANTYIALPTQLTGSLVWLAKKGLTVTLFLIGSGLSVDVLRSVGIKPMVQGILLWIVIALLSLAVIML